MRVGRRRPGHALRGPRARRLTGAVQLVAVDLRRGGPCTRCRPARCNGSTTPPHPPGSTYSLPPRRGEIGALVLPSRGACSRPSCQGARPYIRPMARTDGVVCEWVAVARATPSGDHALAAFTGAVQPVAVDLRRGGPCTRCRPARYNGSTTPPHQPGSTYSLPPWRGGIGALVLPSRGACSRPSCPDCATVR